MTNTFSLHRTIKSRFHKASMNLSPFCHKKDSDRPSRMDNCYFTEIFPLNGIDRKRDHFLEKSISQLSTFLSKDPLHLNITIQNQAYECKPAITRLTKIRLNMMMAKPMTASQADFSPCQPFDIRRCKKAA
jgi:hypothetical protein